MFGLLTDSKYTGIELHNKDLLYRDVLITQSNI